MQYDHHHTALNKTSTFYSILSVFCTDIIQSSIQLLLFLRAWCGVIKQTELDRFILGYQLGGAYAQQPDGSSVPQFAE